MHRSQLAARLAALTLALTACGGDSTDDGGPVEPGPTTVIAEPVVSGLAQPVHLTAPSGDDRLFVAQLGGVIRVIKDDALLPTPFLDLSAKVSTGGEGGLLSMAFDPQFATNRRFYVSYTDVDGNSVVERYLASAANPDVADPASNEFIIGQDQPDPVHNGGHILFGPDGHLYLALGDGGQSTAAARDRTNLLGTLVRIDVRGAAPYAIPPDNPYVAHATFRPEIWAYGLRNPWRIAFDVPSNRLYIADVGQDVSEEVNIEPVGSSGLDYGWDVMEGGDCYLAATCDMSGKVLPKHTYGHEDGRCSITGGEVYRGDAMPDLRGAYFYADFCRDGVRSLRFANGAVTDHRLWPVGDLGMIVSFGKGGDGELYVVSMSGGIHRLAPAP